jgi:hypothetical protein
MEHIKFIKIQILFSVTFFSENRAVGKIMSKNFVEPERTQMTIWRCVECWISKATRAQAHARIRAPTTTHTRTQIYIILIAFPWQQRFRERASLLRYTYISVLSFLQHYSTSQTSISDVSNRSRCRASPWHTICLSCTGGFTRSHGFFSPSPPPLARWATGGC